MPTNPYPFLYLNGGGRWNGFQSYGLALTANGSLQLEPLPALSGDPPTWLETWPAPAAPAGMVILPDGRLLFSLPDENQVMVIDPCPQPEVPPPPPAPACPGDLPAQTSVVLSQEQTPWRPAPCLGPAGGQLNRPRGLLYSRIRKALAVADSGSSTVRWYDIQTWQLIDVWGLPGSAPGELQEPWSLAEDADDNLYVADTGNGRVQKYNRHGRVQPNFWQTAQAALEQSKIKLERPIAVTVGSAEDGSRIYVLDLTSRAIFVFNPQGDLLMPPFGSDHLGAPLVLCTGDGLIYVGDNASRRILQFGADGSYSGEARGYTGPCAALALDGQDHLWVLPGGVQAPVSLSLYGGFSRQGFCWAGPFSNPGDIPQEWHLLRSSLDLPAGAHYQVFVYVSQAAQPGFPPPPPGQTPWGSAIDLRDCLQEQGDGPCCDERWVRLPLDAPDGLVQAIWPDPRQPAGYVRLQYVWVGAEFSSEGASSPSLRQMRLDFDHPTYLQDLPAVYRKDGPSRRYLERFLTLFESLFGQVEEEIRRLPLLFDPAAAPPGFLEWLGGWLALVPAQPREAAWYRQALPIAFALYGLRGTPRGLEQAVNLFTGMEIRIEEPALNAGWWALPGEDTSTTGASDPAVQNSRLGFSTVLAAADPNGAILDSSAIVDGSTLASGDHPGAALFAGTAFHFTVQLYHGKAYSEMLVSQLRVLLDREKPAHTLYQICVVEPRMRLGYQARLGIDSVVAGPAEARLCGRLASGPGEQVLAGDAPASLGQTSRVGQTTRL